MAYGRNTVSHGSWFQEQQNMINNASESELRSMNDGFSERFESAATALMEAYEDFDIRRDAQRMLSNKAIMAEYKQEFLTPILEELCEQGAEGSETRAHYCEVADQLDEAWDQSAKAFVQESYNTSTYLPLSTLDFPALVKQYIKFLGKDIIPVQTAASVNIEQRIFNKFLVDNQTGEEHEVPALYFEKDENGKPLWKKWFNAGKGWRFWEGDPILLSTIASATGKKINLLQAQYLMDENGVKLSEATSSDPTWTAGRRTRLSYDLNIEYVQITEGSGESATTKKVKLPRGGISIDISTGGVFLNGGINSNHKLPVVDATTNKPTGETVAIDDRLSGVVNFVKGTITASSCGVITGFYLSGHISNEDNMRTIGFREYPELRKFLIADGCRFQLPFTVEDFAEASSSLNFNLYNRLVQELVTQQELFEDEYILEFLDDEFDKYDGAETDVFGLESYTHTEYVDIDPTSISSSFAGDPFQYRTNAIHNGIGSVIYELCDKGKLDDLGFVVYCNPKAARLLKEHVTWTVKKGTEIGGVQMNHAFGLLTDTDVPIRVVASNRVDAYTEIPEYQTEDGTGVSREYFYKIVAYPMDKFHIGYKHLRFARHLTNSPENAAYADAQNPGGAAVMITTSAQYRSIAIQGIQGRVILKNTSMVPDANAGLVETTDADDDGE